MTKPIEWTTTENMPVIFWHRMHVDESGELRDATPADLSAALAAMGEGEREEVLRASGAAASFDMQTAIITDLRAQLKEATRLHSEAESSLDLERTLRRADARFADAKLNESIARADTAAASHLASAGLVAEFRGRLAAAESALDVALADRDRARASLDIVRHDLRGTRAEVDALRSRLIAAETAAAQREPESPTRDPLFSAHTETSKQKEYPLAEGSRWDGETVVDRTGTTVFLIAMGQTLANAVVSSTGNTGPFLADVLALAHRRGLL